MVREFYDEKILLAHKRINNSLRNWLFSLKLHSEVLFPFLLVRYIQFNPNWFYYILLSRLVQFQERK